MAGTPYLAGTGAQTSGGTGTINIPITTSVNVNDSILVCVGTTNTGADATGISDSQGNTYNEIQGPQGSGSISGSVWVADTAIPLTSGTDFITVVTGTNLATVCVAVGDNGVGFTIAAQDQHVSANGSSSSPNSGATGTLNQAYEHAIGFIVNLSSGGNPSWNSPWSSHVLNNTSDSGNTLRVSSAYQDVSSTGSISASASISSTAWSCLLVTDQATNLQIANPTLPNSIVGVPFTAALASVGGIGSVTWSVISGALPPGLSLAGNTISGTPTTVGAFTFTVQASAATFGPTTTATYTMFTIAGVTGALEPPLYGNQISGADSQFSAGFTWAAASNASSVSATTRIALTGAQCGLWTASTAGATTSIQTSSYPVKGNKPYVVSGFMLPTGGVRNLYIGIEWLNVSGGVIFTTGGPLATTPNPTPSSGPYWTPLVQLCTSPPNAVSARVQAWCDNADGINSILAGEIVLLDNVYFSQSNCQVSIDFQNPPFNTNATSGQTAGSDFMDVTSWVRKDVGISLQRGRQDSISEIQAGSASFTLQNDQGVFTRFNTNSMISFLGVNGGNPNLQQRVQINMADQIGNWYTRFDGLVSEINYAYDNTGNTSQAQYSCADILAALNRQIQLKCWTYQEILSDNPLYFWPLNDYSQAETIVSFNANKVNATDNIPTGTFSTAVDVSGNNGPPLRIFNSRNEPGATLAWADTTFGVETLADAAAPGSPDGGFNDAGSATEPVGGFWTPGSNQPSSPIRGLVSGENGPYTTPLPNILLTPSITPASATNTFLTVSGWQLIGELQGANALATANNSYSFEIFFCVDPVVQQTYIQAAPNGNVGPFICWGIGSTRKLFNIVAGIYLSPTANTESTFQVNTYTQPPVFINNNFGGSPSTPSGSIGDTNQWVPDANGLPHHLVVTITAQSSGSFVQAYLDGMQLGGDGAGITLPSLEEFDAIYVGGPQGGYANWYGSLSCCAVYNYVLTQAQIVEHCQRGQYGNYEMVSDQAISELAEFASLPLYWNNLTSAGTGLSITEYFDITGANALTAMQQFEDAESGLLFVNAAGQLSFLTRDWKMGYGGPDLFLPPDTFDGTSLGYELVDQFQINEAAISSVTFPGGSSYINAPSQQMYGQYSQNPVGSPLQLPLFSFSRGLATLGMPSLTYSGDPNMSDLASWQSLSRSDPFLLPASLTVDLLTLDAQTGLTQTDFFNLEIGMLIAPSGTLPLSIPNATLSTQWFIEGINETFTQIAHTIEYFTSPAEQQQAWIPGDPTYGVLGSTTRLGISTADTSAPEADGKDVSHDGGPPFWPPTFTGNTYQTLTELLNPVIYLPLSGNSGTDLSGNNHTAVAQNANCALFRVPNSPIAGDGQCVQMFASASGVLQTNYAPSGGNAWTAECWVNLNNGSQGNSGGNTNPRIFSSSHTDADNGGFEIYLASGNVPTFVVGNGSTNVSVTGTAIDVVNWHQLVVTWDGTTVTGYVDGLSVGTASLSGNLGASTSDVSVGGGIYGGDYLNGLVGQCALYQTVMLPTTVLARYDFYATEAGMNNLAGAGNFFVGGLDLRGISTNLQRMITPPMLVASQQTGSTPYQEGVVPNAIMGWDQIYVDTEGTMGIVPGFPAWYVVTVPGFYEIDACVVACSDQPSGGHGWQSWIVVVESGAQLIQQGIDVFNASICPVGECKRFNGAAVSNGNYTINNPTTRMYLGAGDMISIANSHDIPSTTVQTLHGQGGNWWSMRWVGLSNIGDDRAEMIKNVNGTITITDPPGFSNGGLVTFTNTGCSTYYGSNAPSYSSSAGPNIRNRTLANKTVFQGGNNFHLYKNFPQAVQGISGTGEQYAQVPFNTAAMRSLLTGQDIAQATLKVTNTRTHLNTPGSGTDMMIGLYYGASGRSPWVPIPSNAGSQLQNVRVNMTQQRWIRGQTKTITLPVQMILDMLGTLNGQECSGLFIGDNASNSYAFNGSWNGKPGSWALEILYANAT